MLKIGCSIPFMHFYLPYVHNYIYVFVCGVPFQLVIANMLQTRKSRVIFVTPSTSYEINLTKDQLLAGTEIEEHIVADVVCFKFDCNSKDTLPMYSLLAKYRCSVTKISSPTFLHNDLLVIGSRYELTAMLRCHIFVDC